MFKAQYYRNYKIDVSISDDKREFLFKYLRTTKESVCYKVIYDHNDRELESLEKKVDDKLVMFIRREDDSNNIINNELVKMLKEIASNCEKKNHK